MNDPSARASRPAAVELRIDDAGRLDAQRLLASLAPGTTVRIAVLPEDAGGERRLTGHHNVVLAIVGACALGVAVVAIAGTRWPWTGFRGNGMLWSWLKLLVAPAALASLPLRLASAGRWIGDWLRYAWAILVVALAVTVLGGYELGWAWTGYRGETLWDWLNLLLFPLVLVLLPDWIERGTALGRRGALLGAALLLALALLIMGGYHWGWSWTGFTGNTFRDWLDLLIAPFLLPTACRWFSMYWQARARERARAGGAPG
jgi:hypothetical protein